MKTLFFLKTFKIILVPMILLASPLAMAHEIVGEVCYETTEARLQLDESKIKSFRLDSSTLVGIGLLELTTEARNPSHRFYSEINSGSSPHCIRVVVARVVDAEWEFSGWAFLLNR